jgi:hypothetical protein
VLRTETTMTHSAAAHFLFHLGAGFWPFCEATRAMARALKEGVKEPDAEFRVSGGVVRVVMLTTQPDMYRLEIWD